MKILLGAAAVLALAAGAAQAQNDNYGRDHEGRTAPAVRPSQKQAPRDHASPTRPRFGAGAAPQARAYASGQRQDWNHDRHDGQGRGWDGGHHADRYARREFDGRVYSRGWAGERGGYAYRRFNIGFYAYPHGWYARRWAYGDYLPRGWYGRNYWLDFGVYDLPAPPYGATWVRVGPDAILISLATGQVLSVEYGLFV